jgi:multiple sugar transport system substrate-binding protein
MQKRWMLAIGVVLVLAIPMASAQECKLPAQSSPVTLNLVSFRFPMMEFYTKAIEACAGGGIRVNATFLQVDAFQAQVGTALAARGNSPYQVIWSNPNFVTQWGSKGWLLPLNLLIAKYGKQYSLDDIPNQLWNNGTINGRRYGVPLNFNTQIVFYRKDIFDELGLKPPTTFDEFLEVLKKLDAAKKTRYPTAIAFGGTQLAGEFHNNLMAFGGRWFDEQGRPAFNSEAGLKAAQAIRDWLQFMPPDVLSYTNDNVMVALQQGDIAISKIWLTRAAPMEDPNVSRVVGKIAYAPAFRATPNGPVAATAEGDMYSIPANTSNPELAFLAIMEAIKPSNQLLAARFGMVSRASIANNPELVKANPAWPAALQNARNAAPLRPFVPYMGIANNIVSRTLSQALTNKSDLKAALDAAAKAVQDEMKAQGFLK